MTTSSTLDLSDIFPGLSAVRPDDDTIDPDAWDVAIDLDHSMLDKGDTTTALDFLTPALVGRLSAHFGVALERHPLPPALKTDGSSVYLRIVR